MKYETRTAISYPMVGAMGKTGTWRDFRPRLDKSKCVKCVKCLICWVYCPEGVIKREEDDSVSIDYEYCKGCGICANECPRKAIVMEKEG